MSMLPKPKVCPETGLVTFEITPEAKIIEELRTEIKDLKDKYDLLESKVDKLLEGV